MELQEYLETRSKKEFAKELGISLRALGYYMDGTRLAPLDVAIDIERITCKRVRPKDLIKKWKEKNG